MTQKEELGRLELSEIKCKYLQAKESESKALDLLDSNSNDVSSFSVAHEDEEVKSRLDEIGQSTKVFERKIKEIEAECRRAVARGDELELQNSLLMQERERREKQWEGEREKHEKRVH